jgi:hypothetical protein
LGSERCIMHGADTSRSPKRMIGSRRRIKARCGVRG